MEEDGKGEKESELVEGCLLVLRGMAAPAFRASNQFQPSPFKLVNSPSGLSGQQVHGYPLCFRRTKAERNYFH